MKIPAFQNSKHWTLADKQTQDVIETLEISAVRREPEKLFSENNIARLGDYVDIANGMVSGMDKAFRFEGDVAVLNPMENHSLMQVAKAKDLGFLKEKSRSRYINIPVGLDEETVKSQFPNFWKQLSQYSEQLQKRYSYGKELPIWEWAFRRSERFLTSDTPKVFVPCKERMTNKRTARFVLVPGGVVATQDVTAIAPMDSTRESIEYILGYLSTIQVSEWIRVRGLMKGGIAEFSEKPIKDIPFRTIDWNDADEVAFHDNITSFVRNHCMENLDPAEAIDELSSLFSTFG